MIVYFLFVEVSSFLKHLVKKKVGKQFWIAFMAFLYPINSLPFFAFMSSLPLFRILLFSSVFFSFAAI